ncbi:MAG: 3-isopropylmalate dehydrogenase [Candidatus Limnocylindrus sp.]
MTESVALPLQQRSGAYDYRVVTAPGDGVGPDVGAAARRVLDATGSRFGFAIEWLEIAAGGCAIDAHGVAIREDDLRVADTADAILLGAVGGPKWDNPNASVRPEQALFALRTRYELFANLRPVTVLPELYDASPLKSERLTGVDLMMVRELTGGLYFGTPSGEEVTPTGRRAVDTLPYHEDEIRRIAVVAFELARTRGKRVASIDKANVLATSRLWRKVVSEVGAEYPDVKLEHRLVDSTAMLLATWPATLDVIVTENLFGDILSDEAAVLAGSLGMLPSASLGTKRTSHGTFGLYEPIHGSAPDIAGKNLANPIGTILSGAMMLRESLGHPEAAAAVEAAVAGAIRAGARTADLAGGGDAASLKAVGLTLVGTREATDLIVEQVLNAKGRAA